MILHISGFLNSKVRHGGAKRSEQILELLENYDVDTVGMPKNIKFCLKIAIKHPLCFLEIFLFSVCLMLFKGLSLKGAVKLSLFGLSFSVLIKKKKYRYVLLETAPTVLIPIMYYFVWKSIPYIVFPHNIEHMVPGQNVNDFRSISCLHKAEVEGFKKALSVFVISGFDKALLSCYGIFSEILPYFPPRLDYKKLVTINKSRSNNEEKMGYLLLGTVGNRPTFDGMKSAIEEYKSDATLFVAGYGTEVFAEYSSSNVVVLGSVSEDKLRQLMVRVKALLINQPQTTGFLTKIVEFNIAGLPVIVISEYVQSKNLEKFGVFNISIDALDSLSCLAGSPEFKKFEENKKIFLKDLQ